MKAFAVLLDSRPEYLRDAQGAESLLMTPLGRATILRHLGEALASAGHSRLTIATAFAPEPDYERRIGEHGTQVEAIVPVRELAGRIAEYEPSDWLMIVDPSCFPSNGLELGALSLGNNGNGGPHGARHLVALDSHPGGTTERIQVDANGSVRRIQRYYDSATWPFTSGVACSLLPVSCTLGATELPFGSLRDLRQKLAEHGVPSRDIPLEAGAFDLSYERDLLGLSERFVLDHFSGRRAADHGWLDIGPGCQIDPSARLLGPIVLHHGATIGPGATVVGPAVIGAGARVERDAMVAQCVVGAGSVVPAGSTLRHRVVFGAAGQSGPAAAPAPLYEAASALPVDSPEANDDRTAATAVYGWFKAAFDVIAAALGLALLSPLLLLTAVLIKLESKGPVFYRDEREGRGGRLFGCLKFRSMFAGAEAHQRALMAKNQVDGPQFKMARDPRVTRLGRVLRALSIDELPQLINVLFLEMSLVGPRPSPFRENQMCVPWRQARLSVRPGITGLWQVCRHRRSQGDFHQWIHYDLLYVRHMSCLVDLKILVATVLSLGGQRSVPLSRIISPRVWEEAL